MDITQSSALMEIYQNLRGRDVWANHMEKKKLVTWK